MTRRPRSEPTTGQEARDERAEEAEGAMRAAFSEIHGQKATRLYTVAEVKQIVYPLINCISAAGYHRKHPELEITDEILDHAISRTRHRALRGEPAYPDDLETIIGAAYQKRSGTEVTHEGVARAVQVMLHEGLAGRTWPEYARAVLEAAALQVPVGEGEQ